LEKAVDILCECRKQLMFTYIFAYYVEDDEKQIEDDEKSVNFSDSFS